MLALTMPEKRRESAGCLVAPIKEFSYAYKKEHDHQSDMV